MRRALTWVLWTPRRATATFTAVAVAAVAAVVALGVAASGDPENAGRPAASTSSIPATERPVPRPTTSTTAPSATTGRAKAGEVDEANADPADATAARRAAAAWSSAFLAGHGSTTVKWLPTIRPLTHPSYLPFLIATPTSAIPDTKVATIGRPDLGLGEGTVLVTWENGTEVTVELIKERGDWLVSGASE